MVVSVKFGAIPVKCMNVYVPHHVGADQLTMYYCILFGVASPRPPHQCVTLRPQPVRPASCSLHVEPSHQTPRCGHQVQHQRSQLQRMGEHKAESLREKQQGDGFKLVHA